MDRVGSQPPPGKLDDLVLRMGNLADRHRHAVAEFEQAVGRMGGFALSAINAVLDEANPAPREVHTNEDLDRWMDANFCRIASGLHVVAPALRPAGPGSLDERERQIVDILVERLRPHVKVLHEDLRLRLSRRPSPQAYLGRLKTWLASPAREIVLGGLLAQALIQTIQGDAEGSWLFWGVGAAAALVPPGLGGRSLRAKPSRRPWAVLALVVATVGALTVLGLTWSPWTALLGLAATLAASGAMTLARRPAAPPG